MSIATLTQSGTGDELEADEAEARAHDETAKEVRESEERVVIGRLARSAHRISRELRHTLVSTKVYTLKLDLTHLITARNGLLLLVGFLGGRLVKSALAVGLQAVMFRSRPSTVCVAPPGQQHFLEGVGEQSVEGGRQ